MVPWAIFISGPCLDWFAVSYVPIVPETSGALSSRTHILLLKINFAVTYVPVAVEMSSVQGSRTTFLFIKIDSVTAALFLPIAIETSRVLGP